MAFTHPATLGATQMHKHLLGWQRISTAANLPLHQIVQIKEAEMAIDPVCGMTVSGDSKYRLVHQGETYLFCSEHCQHKFRDRPQQYVQQGVAAPPASIAVTSYTCPMHPEVVQDHPGNCPKCGMALEPRNASAED
ncbi:MAG: YHS domain-containing protein, partial [Candidatus Methylopumilus sp.]